MPTDPPAARRVLVVEDAPLNRDLLRDILEEAGYWVLPTDRPVDPADLLQLRPDLVILEAANRPAGTTCGPCGRSQPRPTSQSCSARPTSGPSAPPTLRAWRSRPTSSSSRSTWMTSSAPWPARPRQPHRCLLRSRSRLEPPA